MSPQYTACVIFQMTTVDNLLKNLTANSGNITVVIVESSGLLVASSSKRGPTITTGSTVTQEGVQRGYASDSADPIVAKVSTSIASAAGARTPHTSTNCFMNTD
jgi:hypothetical protein